MPGGGNCHGRCGGGLPLGVDQGGPAMTVTLKGPYKDSGKYYSAVRYVTLPFIPEYYVTLWVFSVNR